MKKVRIFVASSIVSFRRERKRMGACFCQWNNRLISQSVFLDVKFCEELDNAVPEKRKQDEYNSYIENSDLFILMTDSQCGNYTAEEFEVACASQKHPQLLVFCRQSEIPLSDGVNHIKRVTEQRGAFLFYADYQQQVESCLLSYVGNLIHPWGAGGKKEEHLKKITFFFGTSDLSYEDERNEILRFVLGLNEKMLDKGVYIQAEPDAVMDSSSQGELVEKHKSSLDESEAAFFLFFSKVNQLLKTDFQYAVEQFHQKAFPKIFTYFFHGISAETEEIRQFKQYIDCELKHYYSEFSNVDSIKLSILIQLLNSHIPGFRLLVEEDISMTPRSRRSSLTSAGCVYFLKTTRCSG